MQAPEEKISALSTPVADSPCSTDGVIAELADREQRKNNLIMYNLEESSLPLQAGSSQVVNSSYNQQNNDMEAVRNVLIQICPTEFSLRKVFRLGIKHSDRPRPIKVILSSREEVVNILKNKSKYKGAARINEDLTIMQQTVLKNIRSKLATLRDKGDHNYMIKYFYDVPRIVKSDRMAKTSSRKN